jgi:hypothetical protein
MFLGIAMWLSCSILSLSVPRSGKCVYWQVKPTLQYVADPGCSGSSSSKDDALMRVHIMSIFMCESKTGKISWYTSWVIMQKREILQCHRYQKVCSCEANFKLTAMKIVYETTKCAVV